MLNITDLLDRIKENNQCVIRPVAGQPSTEGLVLPEDVTTFYSLCGGITLFRNQPFQIDIVEPATFIRANPVIVGEPCEDDKSYNWFIIANDGNGQYITIDLSEVSSGKCYDSFWDRHGLPGANPVIANSFTELLALLLNDKGQRFYWLEADFVPTGDAYDD